MCGNKRPPDKAVLKALVKPIPKIIVIEEGSEQGLDRRLPETLISSNAPTSSFPQLALFTEPGGLCTTDSRIVYQDQRLA